MAIEIKDIISINADAGRQKLADLRKEINDLRAAIANLDETSEEYKIASEQIYKDQKELASVMNASKKYIDAEEGSMNDLLATLRQLKEQWKATGDEVERAELGVKINEVKAKVNEMNESIGNYQHNVGNYTNSIIDAFGKMGLSVTSLTRPLKDIGVDIKAVDTSIKLLAGSFKLFAKDNITALTAGFNKVSGSVNGFIGSLNGVKAAILATGLGALVVLLGELVAHWDDVTAAVGRWIGVNQTAVLSADQINASIEQTNNEIDYNIRIMKARGDSEEAMIDYQLKATNAEILRLKAIVEQSNALLDNVKWWWERKRVIEQSDAAAAAIEELEKQRTKLLQDREVLKVLRQRQAEIEAEREALKKNTAAVKDNRDAYVDMQREIDALTTAAEREANKVMDEEQKKLDKAMEVLQGEMDARKTELELENEQYEAKKAILEEYNLSTEELEANHWDRIMEIRAQVEQAEYEELQRQRTAQEKIDKDNTEAYKKLMKARQEATANMASGTAGILKGLSAAMGESTKLGKGFAIAAATIDTIASAVTGFRAGMNQWADAGPMAWMAPVQAAINATAALVAGYAQVQKIQSVDTSGNASASAGGATAVAMPNIEGLSSPMEYTRQVTTQTEQEEMNRDQRVYILESDIQDSNRKVRIRENESTF